MNAERGVRLLQMVTQCRLAAATRPGDPAYAEALRRAEFALDEYDNERGICRPGRAPVRKLGPVPGSATHTRLRLVPAWKPSK